MGPLVAVAAAAAAVASTDAQAGNVDTYHLSNDAAVSGGAITARARGGGALWYNPAGLAADVRDSVDVSANAYALRFGGNQDFVSAPGQPAQRRKLATLDFSTIPTALAYTRRVGAVNAGFGVFVPSERILVPRSDIILLDGHGASQSELTIDQNTRYVDTYAGLGLGVALTPTLRLGATLFGFYGTRTTTQGRAVSAVSGGTTSTQVLHATDDEIRIGLQLVWGLQWSPNDEWSVGLTFRSPVQQVYRIHQNVTLLGGSGVAPGPSTVAFEDTTGFSATLLRPMRLHLGAERALGDARLSAEVSLLAPFYDATTNSRQDPVVNARAGILLPLTGAIAMGGGFWTDFSQEPRNPGLGNTVIDYFGISLGGEVSTGYATRQERATGLAPPRRLVTSTSLALSYAVGVGRVGNVALSSGEGGALVLRPSPSDVVAHEIMLYLGSSFAF